ncbi:hypothetical protein L596_001364 [Steinernema carpocapsae]|uniref:MARVEL domain-containing protein n=1 Tax=Steinernema carpocapsae TaxID=34508 RepID=A0A4U8ULC0_STECR|nr:hypothetical protein L596_001364 [Steinernema carpocapsae]
MASHIAPESCCCGLVHIMTGALIFAVLNCIDAVAFALVGLIVFFNGSFIVLSTIVVWAIAELFCSCLVIYGLNTEYEYCLGPFILKEVIKVILRGFFIGYFITFYIASVIERSRAARFGELVMDKQYYSYFDLDPSNEHFESDSDSIAFSIVVSICISFAIGLWSTYVVAKAYNYIKRRSFALADVQEVLQDEVAIVESIV